MLCNTFTKSNEPNSVVTWHKRALPPVCQLLHLIRMYTMERAAKKKLYNYNVYYLHYLYPKINYISFVIQKVL